MRAFNYSIVFAVLCGSALCVPADHRASPEKLKEAAALIVNDCKDQEGASDADVAALSMRQLPETHQGLCMIQCLLNTAKIMKNGKLNKKEAIEFFTPALKGDESKLVKMREMMDVCEKELGDIADGCIAAKLLAECSAKHGKEYGLIFTNQLKE